MTWKGLESIRTTVKEMGAWFERAVLASCRARAVSAGLGSLLPVTRPFLEKSFLYPGHQHIICFTISQLKFFSIDRKLRFCFVLFFKANCVNAWTILHFGG